ncbi:hypothetical protein MASR2M74_04810 [Paracoccaceae bacterium]
MEAGMNGMHDLDDLFAEARATGAQPSAALMARVMADAGALQPQARTIALREAEPRGLWVRIAALFAGGGVMAGMGTAAAVAGLFLGFVQPAPVAALTEALGVTTVETSYDFLPGIDPLIAEE